VDEDVTAFHVVNGSRPLKGTSGDWVAEPLGAVALRRRMDRRRRILVAAAGTATVLAGIASFGPRPAGDTVEQTSAAGCVVANHQEAPHRMYNEEPHSDTEQRWNAARQRVSTALEARFGRDDWAEPPGSLTAGLIGQVPDYPHAMTVIVDPGLPDKALLEPALREAAGPDLDVRLRDGCHTAAELVEARAVVSAATYHPDAGDTARLSGIDARTSSVRVTVDDDRPDVADALRDRLGDRVTIELRPRAVGAEGCHAASPPGSC
jgi:hypothetical protein